MTFHLIVLYVTNTWHLLTLLLPSYYVTGSNYKSGIRMLHIWTNMSHTILLFWDGSKQTMLHANSKMYKQ